MLMEKVQARLDDPTWSLSCYCGVYFLCANNLGQRSPVGVVLQDVMTAGEILGDEPLVFGGNEELRMFSLVPESLLRLTNLWQKIILILPKDL